MGYAQIITDLPFVHNMLWTLETGTRNVDIENWQPFPNLVQRLLLRALALVGIRPKL